MYKGLFFFKMMQSDTRGFSWYLSFRYTTCGYTHDQDIQSGHFDKLMPEKLTVKYNFKLLVNFETCNMKLGKSVSEFHKEINQNGEV